MGTPKQVLFQGTLPGLGGLGNLEVKSPRRGSLVKTPSGVSGAYGAVVSEVKERETS